MENLSMDLSTQSEFDPNKLINYRGSRNGMNSNYGISEITSNQHVLEGNPSASKIIEEFSDLKPSHFIYCSDYNEIPTNRLVILRRFRSPVGDIPDFDNNRHVASIVTYLPLDIDSVLPDISISQNFEDVTSSDALTGSTSKGNYNIKTLIKMLDKVVDNKVTIPDNENYTDMIGHVNFPETIKVRSLGQVLDANFEYDFSFDMNYYNDVDPKVALLDILANIALISIDNMEYIVKESDKNPLESLTNIFGNNAINDLSSKLSDSFIKSAAETIQSIGESLKSMDLDSFLEQSQNAGDKAFQALGKTKTAKTILRKIWYAYNFLSGSETGYWHLTVGNPFNPIFQWGDLILENSTINSSKVLGIGDFPDRIQAKISLKPAKAIGFDELMQKFNQGEKFRVNK